MRARHLFAVALAIAAPDCATVYDDAPTGSAIDCPFEGATMREEMSLRTAGEPRCADYTPRRMTWNWVEEAEYTLDTDTYSASFDGFLPASCSGITRADIDLCTAHAEAVCEDGTVVQEDIHVEGNVLVGTRQFQNVTNFTCLYDVTRTPL